jgi:hypothetical protein
MARRNLIFLTTPKMVTMPHAGVIDYRNTDVCFHPKPRHGEKHHDDKFKKITMAA